MKSPVMESLPVAVTFSGDARVTSLSAAMAKAHGFDRDAMIGESVARMLADRTAFQLPQILDTVRAEGRWEGEVNLRYGSDKPVPTHGTVLPLSGGAGYLLLAKPIMTGREADAYDSPVSEIGRHIRKLVHQMNNSLAIVMGSTQLLSMNSRPAEKMQSDVEKIYSELGRMALVVESLQEYARSLCENAEKVPVERSAAGR